VTTQLATREQAKAEAEGKGVGRRLGGTNRNKMEQLAAQHDALVEAEYRYLLRTWKSALPEARARFLCALQPDTAPDHEHPPDAPAATADAAEHTQSNDGPVVDGAVDKEETSEAGRGQ
jgi:hypothetical protein